MGKKRQGQELCFSIARRAICQSVFISVPMSRLECLMERVFSLQLGKIMKLKPGVNIPSRFGQKQQ